MRVGIRRLILLFGLAGLASIPVTGAKAEETTKVVILVGGHGYDEKGFDKLWRGFDDIAAETWPGSPYTIFDDVATFNYDVIVMYNLSSGITEKQRQNFLKLLDQGVGLVVWHHALANCQDWPEFETIAGAKFWLKPGERDGATIKSGTGFGNVKMHIEQPHHPITNGMTDFELTDEPYNQQTFADNIKVLVTGDHPRSDRPIAWVHRYRQARVFGYQSGHDARAWQHESFQRLMAQGIRWVAGSLPEK